MSLSRHRRLLSSVLSSLLLLALPLRNADAADLRLPAMISDHAVLQRGIPIHIWGWSTPGAAIKIEVHGQTRLAKANTDGEWELSLAPEQAGGPYTLTAIESGPAEQQITVSDLLIGDVWVASGQSNMQMPLRGFPPQAALKNSAEEIASSLQPQIRLLRIDHATSNIPRRDAPNQWTLCAPETAADFSAVAYFFARAMVADQHVAVGVIQSTWGGTPIEDWLSPGALDQGGLLTEVNATRAPVADTQSTTPAVRGAQRQADVGAARAQPPASSHPPPQNHDSRTPGSLYNGMIAPLTPYSIKGFLWYQGESNTDSDARALLYRKLLPAMIVDWRSHWHQGNLPFLYVQLPSFHAGGGSWGLLRDAQRRTLAVTDTAMIVILDVGELHNLHPSDKQTVGARLSLAARGLVYREPVHYAGPIFRQAMTEPGGMRVSFEHDATGLHISPNREAAFNSSFELAAEDHRFVPAHGVIEGSTIKVTSPAVPTPRFVRYAWANDAQGGLENGAGLLASTFTSE